MNKKLKVVLGCSCAVILGTISYVFATNNIQEENVPVEAKVSQASIDTSVAILKKLDSNEEITTTNVIYDEMEQRDFYVIENDAYSVKLETDNSLKGIFTKGISTPNAVSNKTNEEAKQYIINKYSDLDLPTEYELNYIDKYDDLVWLATFEKNYEGIYNKYESVKVYFIPDNDEIVALCTFNEQAKSTGNSITKEEAIQTASQYLNIDSEKVVSATLDMEKSNTFYDSSNSDTSVHSTWKVEFSNNSIVFVDANTNEVIGGDSINA